MPTMLILILVSLLAPQSQATITGDLNCTIYNGTTVSDSTFFSKRKVFQFAYAPSAVVCSNFISDMSCSVLFPAADPIQGYPTAGRDQQRPLACYSTAAATPASIVVDIKGVAINSCPKTCGFCCLTEAYNCPNALSEFPLASSISLFLQGPV